GEKLVIDTHCHLCDRRFERDRVQVSIAPTTPASLTWSRSPTRRRSCHALTAEHPNLFLCVGVHPSEAAKVPESYRAELEDHARHPRVVAIGETGLDFYRDYAPRADQERWFRAQLELGDRLG